MPRFVQAKRVLRRRYQSGQLAGLNRHELRLYLVLLSRMSDPTRPRRWRPTVLRQALGLSAGALNRAAAGLERRGWLWIARRPRTWVVQLKTIGERR